MTLTAGTRLGPYEILAPLGAGGMGEVYRARDTRLGRVVAIKVLPQHMSASPEVRARFEREARAVSSLNHPHICTLHDVGRDGDTDYMVMELVEGETLSRRLAKKGALPTAEVLRIGVQIADALDRAHRAGVIHRDLKPGNVMLTKTGAKLMDFGLAHAAGSKGPAGGSGVGHAPETGRAALTQSPTLAQPLTAEGTIVGTPLYMTPEQLEGREADARSDLWALGCVLYEMATGRRAFEGASQASLIAAIMEKEPRPLAELAPMSPPGLERVVRECLAKDPGERIQSAHDVRLHLEWIAGGSPAVAGSAPAEARTGAVTRRAWTVTAVASAAVLLLAGTLLNRRAQAPLTRLEVLSPDQTWDIGDAGNYAISPDGGAIVFVLADSAGVRKLCVRPLDAVAHQMLDGTEGAQWPFWSPDSRDIAFFAGGKLRRLPAHGGASRVICDANSPRGGTWGGKGVIVFAPEPRGPLVQVHASGGTPRTATALDTTRREISHRFPSFLPDGRRFVFATRALTSLQRNRIFVASIDDPRAKPLLDATQSAVFAPPDWLLYVLDRALMAQRIDMRTLHMKGAAVTLEEQPREGSISQSPAPSCSRNGTLIYATDDLRPTDLVWLSRDGHTTALRARVPGVAYFPCLSPDGRRAVLDVEHPEGDATWVCDLAEGHLSQFAGPGRRVYAPIWNPAGTRVAGLRQFDLVQLDPDGGRDSVLFPADGIWRIPTSWGADGRLIVLEDQTEARKRDLRYYVLGGARELRDYLATDANEASGALSQDGRWLAYSSDVSGREEIYLGSFPNPLEVRRVSQDVGSGWSTTADFISIVWWTREDRELLFVGKDGFSVYGAEVRTAPRLLVGPPRLVVRLPEGNRGADLAPDGERFLVLMPVGSLAPSLTVVQNWARQLERKRSP